MATVGLPPVESYAEANAKEEEVRRRVLEARGGSADAFEWLMQRYGPLVGSLARGWASSPTDTEDLCQEVFLKVFRALDRYDAERPFLPWLYEIARNTCLDHARRHRPPALELEAAAGSAAEPGEPGLPEELRRAVAEGLESLTPREALVVRLRAIEGHSHEEAARRLGCSAESVRSHWCRALPKLRNFLRRGGWVD